MVTRWKGTSDSEITERMHREGLSPDQVRAEMQQEADLQREMAERENARYGIGTLSEPSALVSPHT